MKSIHKKWLVASLISLMTSTITSVYFNYAEPSPGPGQALIAILWLVSFIGVVSGAVAGIVFYFNNMGERYWKWHKQFEYHEDAMASKNWLFKLYYWINRDD